MKKRPKMELEGEYQEAMEFCSPDNYSKANKVRSLSIQFNLNNCNELWASSGQAIIIKQKLFLSSSIIRWLLIVQFNTLLFPYSGRFCFLFHQLKTSVNSVKKSCYTCLLFRRLVVCCCLFSCSNNLNNEHPCFCSFLRDKMNELFRSFLTF